MIRNRTTGRSFKFYPSGLAPLAIWLAVVVILWWFMHQVEANRFLKMTSETFGKYYEWRWVLIAHILGGTGSIITGIIQFWPKLRNYSWKLHRVIGFIYLLSVLMGSLSALVLAFTTAYKVNWAHAFTLQVWAGVWISSTAIAYYAAIQKKFNLHKQWMIRSYIITMAFLISGIIYRIPYIQQLGSFEDVATVLFWVGWAVPLYVYEIVRTSISMENKVRRGENSKFQIGG